MKLTLLIALVFFIVYTPSITSSAYTLPESLQPDSDINSLSEDLRAEKDFSIAIDGRFLSKLAEQLADASTRDVLIKVLPGRLYSSESNLGFAKYQNYLDLDGGTGY